MDARSAEASAAAHLWYAAQASDQATEQTLAVVAPSAWDRQMARRPAGGNTGRVRRTCWAHRARTKGSRFACNASLRWGRAVGLDSPTLLGNGPRLLRQPTSAGQSGRGEGGNESRRACSARGPRVAQVRSTSSRSSGLAAAFATQLVLSSLSGDGNIPGRRWSARDVSSARKGPRVSAVFVASFRGPSRGRRAGEGQMRPEPGRSTRPVRTSVPPAASLPRESSWPSRHAPQGAWPREPAQAGRGSAMARAEVVRRSGALHNVCRLPGSPGSGCMAAERAARERRRCGDTSAAGPTASRCQRSEMDARSAEASAETHLWCVAQASDQATKQTLAAAASSPRRSGWQHRRRSRDALRGAGPKGTVRRRDRAERDDVVVRASGTRSRPARHTKPATCRSRIRPAHGEVRPSNARWLPRRASDEADARSAWLTLHDEQRRCRRDRADTHSPRRPGGQPPGSTRGCGRGNAR
jgi:hypothetical protein